MDVDRLGLRRWVDIRLSSVRSHPTHIHAVFLGDCDGEAEQLRVPVVS